MKTLLLAATCIALALPAQAQFVCDNCTEELSESLRETARIAQVLKDFELMKQQYAQLVATYNVLSHPNDMMNIARNMMQQQIQSPGSAPTNIPGLAFGSQLSGQASRFLNQNRRYDATGSDFAALEQRRQAQATANLQAEAQMGMERAQDRIAGINELQQSIDAQPDVQATAGINARLSSEHLFLQNETNNVGRLQLMQQLSARVDAQRAEQNGRKEAEDWASRAGSAFNQGGY